jgi:mannose-6-phosphate isomerase-like protein (cupin superfamily)
MTTLHTCATTGEQVLGGLGIRPVVLATAGDMVDGHEHVFDHVMFFATGRVHVHATCKEGCNKEFMVEPGTYLLIPKHWRHATTALTDDVKFWCVFPQFDETGARGSHFMDDAGGA